MTPPPAPTRRRFLAALVLVPPALASCSFGGATAQAGPDPLVALASSARADVAAIAAAIAADPDLAKPLEPLRAARAEHATALDAEVARLAPAATPAPDAPAPDAAAPAGVSTLATVRDAVAASGEAAATAALTLPAGRVGLVASVSACCAAYAALMEEVAS